MVFPQHFYKEVFLACILDVVLLYERKVQQTGLTLATLLQQLRKSKPKMREKRGELRLTVYHARVRSVERIPSIDLMQISFLTDSAVQLPAVGPHRRFPHQTTHKSRVWFYSLFCPRCFARVLCHNIVLNKNPSIFDECIPNKHIHALYWDLVSMRRQFL